MSITASSIHPFFTVHLLYHCADNYKQTRTVVALHAGSIAVDVIEKVRVGLKSAVAICMIPYLCNSCFLTDIMASSTYSSYGGSSFDELCNGRSHYACDNTVDIRRVSSIHKAKKRILKHIDDCMKAIEIGRGTKVSQFYIGKTYIHRVKKRGGGYNKIDPMDPQTWKKGGISAHWTTHREEDYGRGGMVVLAVITRDALPPNTTKEEYALILEEKILRHYTLNAPHEKLVNKSFKPGKSDGDKSAAYAIYMAFRDGPEESDESEELDSESEEPDSESEEPDSGSEEPDSGSEEPDSGSEEPDSESEEPDSGSEESDSGSDARGKA